MIALSFTALLVLFISLPLLAIALLSLYYTCRSLHRPSSSTESIYECAQCRHVYAIARTRPMDRCPKCGHLNEAVRT